MVRLFSLLPWPVMALLSALLVWMAQDGYKEELQREAEKAEALRMACFKAGARLPCIVIG